MLSGPISSRSPGEAGIEPTSPPMLVNVFTTAYLVPLGSRPETPSLDAGVGECLARRTVGGGSAERRRRSGVGRGGERREAGARLRDRGAHAVGVVLLLDHLVSRQVDTWVVEGGGG